MILCSFIRFAGHDTTATLLSFAIGMIATHKQVEDKLLAEVDSVLGDRDIPTHDDLSRLTYLKMVRALSSPAMMWELVLKRNDIRC